MSAQESLFDAGPELRPIIEQIRVVSVARDPEHTTLQQQFEQFHAANPAVYQALALLARQLRARGRQKIGIGMLFEVLRWQYQMTTADAASDFKLNNNYRSRYARMLMEREPDLADAFETRSLHA